jgi:Putative adhesin
MRFQRIRFTLLAALGVAALTGLPAAAAAAEGSFERTLKVSGAVNLQVDTGSGSVNIRAGDSNQVLVKGRIKVSDWSGQESEEKVKRLEANPPVLQSGNDIRVGHIDDPQLRRNISISYEVIVPQNTQVRSHTGSGNMVVGGVHGPAEVSSGSGNVKVSDIGEEVRADTGSGNIDMDHIQGNVHARTGSGTVRATAIAGGFDGETGSGDLTLEQTAPGSVHVNTGSGTLELKGVKGSLEAKAGSGSIQAEGEPTGAWVVHSGSGGIRLRFPANAAFDLSARTSSGSITVNHPLTVQGSIGKKEVRGKVLNGGVPVEVETGSGNVEIE